MNESNLVLEGVVENTPYSIDSMPHFISLWLDAKDDEVVFANLCECACTGQCTTR
jgi:hypothetical protein